jgi:hypothetical protein
MRRLLLIAFVLLARPISARACSCASYSNPAFEFRRAGAVFTGEVIAIDGSRTKQTMPAWLGWMYPGPSYGYRVTFSVNRSWKGVTTSKVDVTTGYGGGDCGFLFDVGREYLVYADGDVGVLGADICSRTVTVAAASDDMKYLSTLPELTLPTRPASDARYVWLIVLACAVGLVSFFEFRRRRRHSA